MSGTFDILGEENPSSLALGLRLHDERFHDTLLSALLVLLFQFVELLGKEEGCREKAVLLRSILFHAVEVFCEVVFSV